jgi:hypothetical protein
VLSALQSYLNDHSREIKTSTPALTKLFFYSKAWEERRSTISTMGGDYPGLAIVQNADGGLFAIPMEG